VDNFGVDWWAMGFCWGVTGRAGRRFFICVCTALSVVGWVSREISVFSVQLVRGLLGVIGL
jgi:hypothetical protein